MNIKTTFLALCLGLVSFAVSGQTTPNHGFPPLFSDSIKFYVKDNLVVLRASNKYNEKDVINKKYFEKMDKIPSSTLTDAVQIAAQSYMVLNYQNPEATRYMAMGRVMEIIAKNENIRLHDSHTNIAQQWAAAFGKELEDFQEAWEATFEVPVSETEAFNYDTIPLVVNGTTIYIVSDDVANLDQVEISTALTEMVQLAKEIIQTSETEQARIDSLRESGNLSEEELLEMEEDLNSNLAEKIERLQEMADNAEGISLGEDLSQWTEAWKNQEDEDWSWDDDDDDDFDFDDIWSDIKIKKNKKKANINRTVWETDFFFGLNTLVNSSGARSGGDSELKLWDSNQFYLGYNGLTAIGKKDSRLKIRYGVGYYWHRYSFERNAIFVQGQNNVFVERSENMGFNSFDRALFRTRYLHIPIMLMIDNRNKPNSNFVYGIGGFAGIRTVSKTQYRGQDQVDNRVINENRGTFFVNDFRYGLQAQVGYGDFRVGVEYELTPLFRNNASPELYRAAVTVGWSW